MQIDPLERHPTFVSRLADWFEAEWPDFYATQPPGAARASFLAPGQVWFVAVRDGEPLGTVALRDQVISGIDGYTPAVGGLYVDPAHRRHGVGGALLEAVAKFAFSSGAERLYLSTIPARRLVQRLGWREIAFVDHQGEQHPVFMLERAA